MEILWDLVADGKGVTQETPGFLKTRRCQL